MLALFLCPIGLDRTTSAPGSTSTDEETVRSLEDQERKAVLGRNYAPLEHLWCEQLTVNSPANNVVIGRHDVLARVQKSAVYSSFERKIEFIRIDGNFAIIMGAETVQPIGDAPRLERRSSEGSPISGRRTGIRGVRSRVTPTSFQPNERLSPAW